MSDKAVKKEVVKTKIVKWTGPDKFSPKYGKLTKNRQLEVKEHHAKSWIDSGRAVEVSETKSNLKEA